VTSSGIEFAAFRLATIVSQPTHQYDSISKVYEKVISGVNDAWYYNNDNN
jgi:hypothetical protein